MILKIIFLVMLCIPVACVLLFLMIDTLKDIPKATQKEEKKSDDGARYRKTRNLRIAK